ncbi:MAG: response regulator [Bacteroidota bacterium]
MAEGKPKLLIVEDDLDVAEMLNGYFRQLGYDVFTVNWGADGVRSAQTVHPDLVILDIRLPDIDGYEVAQRLRTDRRTADIPILFLSEKRERVDRLRGLELGADDYITKPFDVTELRLRVRNALARSRQGSLTNPVSGLPQGALVDERLVEYVRKGDFALLLISLENMDAFREAYGFVASDDVLRAFSMMITNTLPEIDEACDFIGHLSPTEFVVAVPAVDMPALQERLRTRLEQSVDYFYPIRDREKTARRGDRLVVKIAGMQPGLRLEGADQIKTELLRLKR